MSSEIVAAPRVIYPESDGKPIAESDFHRQEIFDLLTTLQDYYRDDALTYISGNLLLYYEEGDPAAVVSPDVFVVRGVANRQRRVYKLWEEQVPPTVVIEISSRSTRLEDQGTKRALYAMLGVAEYFLFDPLGEYLKPAFQGYRLAGGEYLRMAPAADGALISEALGLRLRPEPGRLGLFDLATGERLLRPAEMAEARVAALEAELARLRNR